MNRKFRLSQREAMQKAYACAHMAADLASEIESLGLHAASRRQTEALVRLLQEAACAARALDNYKLKSVDA
jgi:isopropylmalate/homocitrate/citramalate synthase